MYRRHVLIALAGMLSLATAACGSASPEDMPDAAGAPDAALDAAPDAAGGPDTEITSGPSGSVTAGATLRYEFTSDDAAATFECRIDVSAFAVCTSPHAITALVGAHTFEVRARAADGAVDETPASREYTGTGASVRVRLMAGNLTSGNLQAYEAPGTRIFQGLKPDIAMVQEMNVGNNSTTAVRAWVDTAFGAEFAYYRESGAQIPNGVVSRYPILASGTWQDTESPNREFVYARIDVPGPKDLWAISVHLLTDDSRRPAEATELVGYINANVPAGDYLVIAGDFNTDSRTESAVVTLGQVVEVGAPYPADQGGDQGTNAGRSKPYDWVMFDDDLAARQTAVTIGANTYPAGLVFDSRVYAPLADVTPVLASDSSATNMQHMGVVKDVILVAQ